MLSDLGTLFIIAALLTSFSIIYFSFKELKISNNLVPKKIYKFSLFQLFFTISSFFVLLLAYIFSDFTLVNVYENSHTNKPLFYKISGTWGNHEGSLLLWINILVLFSSLFLFINKNRDKKFKILTLLFQNLLIIIFLIFLLSNSNPFSKLFPVPLEGLGLNPILQDPALAIHPPLLYVGFVGSSIYFSAALAALISKIDSQSLAISIKPWVLVSWFFQTVGILVGSIWAYYELGWGGFWFWDPVENISLMPWLCLTALMHSIIVLEKRKLLASWTLVLSIATFTLSMCGTFLVRSGILNSVHTFANDPERGIFILIFLFFLILASLFIFFVLYKPKIREEQKSFLFSKETSILVNNLFMMYFLSCILIGTIYPIFLEVIANEKISVGPPFYNKLLIPFLIPFLIFMSIGPKVKWVKDNFNFINKKLILIFIVCVLVSYLIINKSGYKSLYITILTISSLYLFIITINDFFKKSQINLGQKISHFGFGLLILCIILNGVFSTETITNIKVGEKHNFKGGTIYFQKLNNFKEENYISIIGTFSIKEKDKNEIFLKPELRIFDQPDMITSEASIKTTIFTDKFLVMNLVKGNNYYNIRYQTKPFMIWIWLSTIILAFGALLNFFYKKKK